MANSEQPSAPRVHPESAAIGNGVAPKSFEVALSELEAIVARMESADLSLEQSLVEYKRGASLLQFCQAALRDAQQQVRVLEAGILKDFSGDVDNS
ncbi:MAG: exodeoxyribonuclease VII small subunit [Betaproteobacteria bacterium]